MSQHSKGLHHYSIRKRIHEKYEKYPSGNKVKRFYDKLIYVVVILAPIVNLPQLYKVWIEKTASGVSVMSWFAFSFISIAWLIYGILHKDKHIIIMNVLLFIIQILIGTGALIYR